MDKVSHVSRRGFLAGTLGASFTFPDIRFLAGGWAKVSQNASRARGGTVQTVLGPVDTSKLGFTQSHEHVCSTSAGFWGAWPEYMGGGAKFVRAAVERLKRAKDEGLNSFVDLTTIDLGRDIRLIEEVS